MNSIKERYSATREKAFDIIVKHIHDLSEEANIAKMLSVNYMRDILKRSRNLIIGHDASNVIVIPEILRYDAKGNLFLRFDSSFEDNQRIILFFSEYKRKYIQNIETFIIDGTFKSSP
jgi:hypothetical protein